MVPATSVSLSNRYQVWLFFGAVYVAAATVLAWLMAQSPALPGPWTSLVFWFVVGLLTHLVAFEAAVFGGHIIRLSVGYAASTACIVLFPPGWAALLVGLSSMSWPQITGKVALHKVLFNRSMFVLSAGLAALVYQAGRPWADAVGPGGTVFVSVLASFVYFAVNYGLLTAGIAVVSQQPLARVAVFVDSFPMFLSYITLGLMGVLLALIYTNIGWWGVFIACVPLIANYLAMRYISLLRQSYTQVVQALGDSLDLREHGTAGHSLRIGALARLVGEKMRLSRPEIDTLYLGGILHDVGKLGLEDKVLLGNGTLSPEDWEKVRQHPALGSKLLEPYQQLQRAAAIVRHHHERFDGSGYPHGCKSEEIPLGARIVTVVDSFDAIYFGRPYQQTRTWEEACAELQRCAGTQFDPKVVEAFLRIDRRQVIAAVPTYAFPDAAREHVHQ